MSITLSQGEAELFISQFDNTLYHLLQQTESKFQQAVDIKPLLGAEDKAFDAIGKLALTEKTERNPQNVQDLARLWQTIRARVMRTVDLGST